MSYIHKNCCSSGSAFGATASRHAAVASTTDGRPHARMMPQVRAGCEGKLVRQATRAVAWEQEEELALQPLYLDEKFPRQP